ncbi:primosomal protein N' [Candidatus Marinamargulisbacteria bacterium SCGC AG-343-D04]|nr:primosomal protein N' [Candidatus Marinamargulisbacteria bacterium SCGC AG-343-D04]
MKIASVLVFRGIPILYSYRIPDELSHKCKAGVHVNVSLGRSETLGCILSLSDQSEFSNKIKDISSIHEELPTLSEEIVSLIQWFYTYYQTTPYKAYQTIVGKRKLRCIKQTNQVQGNPSPFSLNEDQAKTFQQITECDAYSMHLIHGITGSGKTEIYMRLAEWVIKQNKSIIICCPEISLTPQYTAQFNERFGDLVSVIHSGLTPKKRDEAYTRIIQNMTPIVIGPRSAIFSPLSRIGMIVIDEEHDGSYKQENHPRYFTHTIAKKRCEFHGCPLVLGSATPSLESYSLARSDTKDLPITYNSLNKRATGSSLPQIKIVDMTCQQDKTALLSPTLIDHIQDCLDQKQKTIILMNRRGYAPYISCQQCGKIHSCSECQLSFTYHKDKTFRCHRCDIKHPMTHTCSYCKKPRLAFGGQAIQKVEQELYHHFSDASIIRLDKDTAKNAKQMEELLTEFKSSGDILVGTQLIAKGHHIEDVTLVGVLGIDTQLSIPDFRSSERAFQLLMQVSGRAGRGAKKGKVVVQTNQSSHYSIQFAKDHNVSSFMETENDMRQCLNYPPFSRLTNLIMSSPYESSLKTYSQSVTRFLNQKKIEGLSWIGPKPAPFEKVRNYFRHHIVFKHDTKSEQAIRELISSLPMPPKGCRVIPDFDPQQLL